MTRDQKLEVAYNQGYEAYIAGYHDNEYQRGGERWSMWEKGYWDANEDISSGMKDD